MDVSAPAGPCEWCGGPQHWTVIRGLVHVSCILGCRPLPLEYLEPPPDSERDVSGMTRPEGTLLEGGGSRTYEGDEPDEPADPILEDELPF